MEWQRIRWTVSQGRVTKFFHLPPSVEGQKRMENLLFWLCTIS